MTTETSVVPGVVKTYTQHIYDTIQLAVAAAGQTVSFFLVPLGGALTAAINKTYSQTNLVRAGSLEKGLSMDIEALSFFIHPTIAAGTAITLVDFRAIYQASNINILINQTSVFRCQLCQVPPAVSENQYFSNIAPAATEFQSNHGLGSAMNVLQLKYPLGLSELQSIQVDLQISAAVAAVNDVTLTLWGTQTRPVT